MLAPEPRNSDCNASLSDAQFSPNQALLKMDAAGLAVPEAQPSADETRMSQHPIFRISPPDIKLYTAGEYPILRADHPVRDALQSTLQVLSKFADQSLHTRPEFGFKQGARESVDLTNLISELRRAKTFFETTAVERADGLPPSIMIRNIAGEAAQLLEHFVIELVTSYGRSGPTENDLPPLLHTVAETKQACRKLMQHFDAQMVSIAAQSGLLGEMPAAAEDEPLEDEEEAQEQVQQ